MITEHIDADAAAALASMAEPGRTYLVELISNLLGGVREFHENTSHASAMQLPDELRELRRVLQGEHGRMIARAAGLEE